MPAIVNVKMINSVNFWIGGKVWHLKEGGEYPVSEEEAFDLMRLGHAIKVEPRVPKTERKPRRKPPAKKAVKDRDN